jgi:hypothetical protein
MSPREHPMPGVPVSTEVPPMAHRPISPGIVGERATTLHGPA